MGFLSGAARLDVRQRTGAPRTNELGRIETMTLPKIHSNPLDFQLRRKFSRVTLQAQRISSLLTMAFMLSSHLLLGLLLQDDECLFIHLLSRKPRNFPKPRGGGRLLVSGEHLKRHFFMAHEAIMRHFDGFPMVLGVSWPSPRLLPSQRPLRTAQEEPCRVHGTETSQLVVHHLTLHF